MCLRCIPWSADAENNVSLLLHTDRIENRTKEHKLNPNISVELPDCMSVFLRRCKNKKKKQPKDIA